MKRKNVAFTVVSRDDDRCTCGHMHRLYGRAMDCLDRLADNACFCPHHVLAGQPCSECGGKAIPRDTSGLWDNPEIVAIGGVA